MPHTIKDKAGLLARVRRIQGQAGALERALEQEAESPEQRREDLEEVLSVLRSYLK
jgi:DNA-binding FrmR family transcriptional regulator